MVGGRLRHAAADLEAIFCSVLDQTISDNRPYDFIPVCVNILLYYIIMVKNNLE